MPEPLPTCVGSVVDVYGDKAMLTKFGNWVTEGVFTLTPEEMAREHYTVVFDGDRSWGE